MKISENYRLNRAVLCISSENVTRRVPIMIPAGAIVTLQDGPLDGLRMVDVLWQKKTVMMFTIDLKTRGTLLSS